MYLLDTNILVEVLLRQEHTGEVKELLKAAPSQEMFLTEFSPYSIGILLLREKRHDDFRAFVVDMLGRGAVQLIGLSADDMHAVARVSQRCELDFDDACQYVAAEQHDLTIVSFDCHFDRTERGRKTPAELLEV